MILASANVRSPVRCGREVWPPVPSSRTSIRSAALVIGPVRTPIVPTSTAGSECRAKIRSTSVEGAVVDQVHARRRA